MKIYLDLLPKQRKDELKREKLFHKILRQELLFLFPIILLIIILCNIFYLLLFQRDALVSSGSQASQQGQYQEVGLYEDKFKQVNENATKLLKIQAGHLHWTPIFIKLSASTPDGITITDLSTKDFTIFLVGKARNREVLLSFKDSLEKDGCFSAINVPLSNLVLKDDIDFQIDLKINKDCLKKK